MKRSLLLADVDGTLVDASGNLWPEAYCLVEAADASDRAVALCSARPAWSINSLSEQLGSAVKYAASFQGALVSRRAKLNDAASADKWETVRRCVLDPAVAQTVESLVRPYDSLWWYTESGWHIRSIDKAAKFESQVIHARWTSVGFSHDNGQLLKILIVRDEQPEWLLSELVSTSLPVVCSLSQPGYIEIVSDAVGGDKGAALLRELERYDDSTPHVVAIGDGRNDLGMFSVADIAVTFEDAAPEVRADANVILPADRRVALRQFSDQLMENLLR